MDADIDEDTLVLVNLYNANTETEQIKTIYEIDQLLGDFCLDSNKKMVLAGNLSLFFDPTLEINEMYDEISNGIKIKSKYEWYEFGGKSNKFFLTLEKCRATQNILRKVLSDEREITDLSKINTYIYQFHQHLYNERQNTSEDSICDFLNDLTVPLLTTEQSLSCEGNLIFTTL